MIDRFTIEQRRTAEQIVATWDDETLAGDIGTLNARLARSTGIEPANAAKIIHGERHRRRARG